MTENDPEVLVSQEGAIRILTLNRPHRLNAFTAEGYRALAVALRAAEDDPDVRVVLLQGAGRAFSSGVDLDALRNGDHAALAREFAVLVDVLIGLGSPLVAAVQGPAVGFGATLLLHCDVVVLADGARLRYPFTQLGTAPEAGSSWLLPAMVGAQRAAEIILTSRWVDASEAVDLGLAARCVPAADLAETARRVADDIARLPGAAVRAAKELLKSSVRSALPEALRRESAAAGALARELGRLVEV